MSLFRNSKHIDLLFIILTSIYILYLATYSAAQLTLYIIPGRPTYVATCIFDKFKTLAILIAFLQIILLQVKRYRSKQNKIILLLYIVGSFLPFIPNNIGIVISLSIIFSTIIIATKLNKYLSLIIILISIFLSSIMIFLGILTKHICLEAYGWSSLIIYTITGILIGFSSSIIILIRKNIILTLEEQTKPSNNFIGFLPSIILIIATFLILRIRSPHGIYSLDTLFNLRFCKLMQHRQFSIFFSWRRPLYVSLIVLPSSFINCPWQVYDIAVPFMGLAILSYTVYKIALLDGLSIKWAAITSIISIAFWMPFFLYAGLQTNLLALPIALVALRNTVRRRLTLASILWLLLGLMHPWTLLYYALSLVVIYALQRRLLDSLDGVASTMPGWISYLAIEIINRSFNMGYIARLSLNTVFSYIEGLGVYFWGLSIQGLILVTGVLILLLMRGELSMPKNSLWILGPTITALLLAPLPNVELVPRYLINSTIPLVIGYFFSRLEKNIGRILYFILISLVLIILFAFIYHLNPIIQ